jgi:hypothetical protein
MREIVLNSRQRMLPADKLAYELGQIPTPKEMEKNRIINYVTLSVLSTLILGLFVYSIYEVHQENKKNQNKKISED